MTSPLVATRLRASAVAASAVALLAASALAAPAAQAARPDAPVLTPWANPGIALDGSTYVSLHTLAWNKKGVSATAPSPNGPWTVTDKKLLTKRPAWASGKNRSVWAPSLIKGGDGRWVAFYSAIRKGAAKSRCIGTAVGDSPLGPFVPDARPISCVKGTNPQDTVPTGGKSLSLIDATPTVVKGQTVLTYKSSRGYKVKGRQMWETAIRMVRLDPTTPNKVIANSVHKNGRSVQLTKVKHKYIEENPSLVYRGGTFTLFTSWGWYGTKDQYWTRYRQNTKLWTGWKAKRTSTLTFPKGTHTWGRGNAQALKSPTHGWLFFWNGQEPSFKRGNGPKHLYVGKLGWKKGKPFVKKVLKRA